MFDHLMCIRCYVTRENPKFDQNLRSLTLLTFSFSNTLVLVTTVLAAAIP